MSFAEHLNLDARLRILQGLDKQTDHRLGDAMLVHVLDEFGHRRSREAIRTLLLDLAERGAVTVVVNTPATMVAELTSAGIDHVARRRVLDGVRRPQPGE